MDLEKSNKKQLLEKTKSYSSSNPSRKVEPKKGDRVLYFFLVWSGVVASLPYFLTVSESDTFKFLYPKRDYGFYNLIPIYASIPFSFALLKTISKFSMATRLFVCIFIQTIFITLIPLCPYLLGDSDFSFFLLIFCAFIAFIFNSNFYILSAALSSVFHPKYSKYYYGGPAVTSMTLYCLKLIFSYKNISYILDVKIMHNKDDTGIWILLLTNRNLLHSFNYFCPKQIL